MLEATSIADELLTDGSLSLSFEHTQAEWPLPPRASCDESAVVEDCFALRPLRNRIAAGRGDASGNLGVSRRREKARGCGTRGLFDKAGPRTQKDIRTPPETLFES